jgi:hypothetical protein
MMTGKSYGLHITQLRQPINLRLILRAVQNPRRVGSRGSGKDRNLQGTKICVCYLDWRGSILDPCHETRE